MSKPITHRPLKIAKKGATQEFLRQHVGHTGDECVLWPFARNAAGYGLAVINGHQTIASRWMCVLAHGEPPKENSQAAHTCGNGNLGCVNPNHLKWKSPKENTADKFTHGTINRGERNGKTTISEDDVRAIRAAPPDLLPLMEKYKLSKSCISKIRGGRRWGHVK